MNSRVNGVEESELIIESLLMNAPRPVMVNSGGEGQENSALSTLILAEVLPDILNRDRGFHMGIQSRQMLAHIIGQRQFAFGNKQVYGKSRKEGKPITSTTYTMTCPQCGLTCAAREFWEKILYCSLLTSPSLAMDFPKQSNTSALFTVASESL